MGNPRHHRDRCGVFDEALGHGLRLEAYSKVRFRPGRRAVMPVRSKSVDGPWPVRRMTTTRSALIIRLRSLPMEMRRHAQSAFLPQKLVAIGCKTSRPIIDSRFKR